MFKQIVILTLCYILFNIKHINAVVVGCQPGTYCPYGVGLLNANLIGYYSFWANNRLLDSSGVTGSLTSTGTPTYNTDCKWSNAQCSIVSSGIYHTLPSFYYATMSAINGWGMCAWYMYDSFYGSYGDTFLYVSGGTNCQISVKRVSGSSYLQFTFLNNNVGYTTYLTQVLVVSTWNHICISNKGRSWYIYENGFLTVSTTAAVADINSLTITMKTSNSNFAGKIDELRIYNTSLTNAIVMNIFSMRNIQCPVGTYQDKADQTACKSCASYTFQPNTESTSCISSVPVGAYTPSTQLSTNNYLIGHWTFQPTNRLTDLTGLTGDLVVTGSVSYTTDCAWVNAEGYNSTGSASNYMKFPTIPTLLHPGLLSTLNGFSVCAWFKGTANAYIVDWRYSTLTTYIFSVYATSSRLSTKSTNNGLSDTVQWASTFSTTVWNHMCVTNINKVWNNYLNGAWDTTFTGQYTVSQTSFTNNHLGQTNSEASTDVVTIDEFRYYNKQLSSTEVSEIYNYRLMACPAGTFQSTTNQKSCTPCALSTYQPSTGQTVCATCAVATMLGTVGCAAVCLLGPLPSTSVTTTPGTALLTTGANYISFNCPSGTYYPSVFNIVSMTVGCSVMNSGSTCSGSGCCIWASSQLSNQLISNGFDGIINISSLGIGLLSTDYITNAYVAIDFSTAKTVSYVILFDKVDSTTCSRENSLQIYIGNTLHNSRTTPSSPTVQYPVTTSPNTLCYTGDTASQGYRTPLVAQCVGTGRYLYVVITGTYHYLNVLEIIVVNQSVCTNCSAGTYSINNGPNSVCTNCPAGYYQTGIGATFCNQCPTGTSQMTEGSSYCIGDFTTGVYDQMGLNISNLIAHYTFQPNSSTRDSTGITGDLTAIGSPTYVQNCQWNKAECRQFTDGNYYTIPSMDIGQMSIGTGWSICFWFSSTGAQDSRLFTFKVSTGCLNAVEIMVLGSPTMALKVQLTNDATTNNFAGASNSIAYNTWYHVCVTNFQYTWYVYVNGNSYSNSTLSIAIPSTQLYVNNFIGQSCGTFVEDTMKIDSVRIYNKVLSTAEVLQIYQYRLNSCPAGSFQSLSGQDSCIPCPIGTSQSLTGQTACSTCASTIATYQGTADCTSGSCTKGPQHSSTISTVNGTAMLTTGGNYISFNCPDGSYYNGIFPVVSATLGCSLSVAGAACTANTCCIWASAPPTQYSVQQMVDGVSNGWNSYIQASSTLQYNFIGIDLGTYKNVANIILIDIVTFSCSGNNLVYIYVGNTSYSNQITPTSGGTAYPIATQNNTLCYIISSATEGYRRPLTIRCGIVGRYVYIVNTVTLNMMIIEELIITEQQTCTLCSPGTYSTYVEPNSKCTSCPIGTYQSQSGMTYCVTCPAGSFQSVTGSASCQPCPFGYYQPDTGGTTCILAQMTGRYSVSSTSVVVCPKGSYQDEPGADTCKPCGLGTYQTLTGQTSCIFCSGPYNSYYGSIACPQTTDTEQCRISLQPSTSLTTTPGMAMLTVGNNYISFNCPSGMYSTTVSTLTPLTVGCTSSYYTGVYTGAVACSTTCCMWMSSQLNGNTTTLSLYGGALNFADSWNVSTTQGLVMNEYFGIDLGSTKYVDSLLLFDVIGLASECNRQDNLQIYIGSTLYTASGSKIASSTGYSYPVNASLNTLCYSGDTSTQGYRQPLVANCKMSGRYVYIVSTSTDKTLKLNEVVVLGQPACTLCPAGTYSINTIPNTECSLCPGGTYSTGSGMTSKSACTICPLGSYSTGMGSTDSSVCTVCS